MLKSLSISVLTLAATPALAETGDIADRPGEEIIVSASRSGEGVEADKLGASVTVIAPDTLEARQTRIVSDVLRDVPGVAVNRIGAVGGQTQIRIRGTEANHVLVLIDGATPGPAHGVDVDADGNGTAKEQRMYQLIRQAGPIGDRTIQIEFLDPGIEGFAFTFG